MVSTKLNIFKISRLLEKYLDAKWILRIIILIKIIIILLLSLIFILHLNISLVTFI